MNESSQASVKAATLVGYGVTALAVVAIPLFVTTDRSPYFWPRIAWVEYLAFFSWAYFGGFLNSVLPSGRKSAGQGGILPIAGVLVIGYVVISLLLVLFCDWPSKGHWAAQFIILVILTLAFVFFEYARKGAVAGAEPVPSGIHAPAQLVAMLRLYEERFFSTKADSPLRKAGDAVKTLREAIQYSLPNVGKIGISQEYIGFAAKIESLCAEMANAHEGLPEVEHVERMRNTAQQLRSQVEYVSSTLKATPS